MMNFLSSRCADFSIEEFLQGRFSSDESRRFETHLEHCESCRSQIEDRAATDREWREAGDLIKLAEWEADDLPAADEDLAAPPQHQINEIQAFLSPSDQPEMLGRLGGYEIRGVIGFGGMGVVLKGFDTALDRVVAIKVLSPSLALSSRARKRFQREARAAAAVTHDNVIEIYGVAENEDLPFIVMPYCRGRSLEERIESRQRLELVEVLRIGIQVARGLQAAHAHGLVHRDIKPANILLNDGIERLVITDFGLARAANEASVTRTGIVAGTPQYMSPEQAQGLPVDARSDLFSFGTLLYKLATGINPFDSDSPYATLKKISDVQPVCAAEVRPELPDWFAKIITRLHEKSVDRRYGSAAEVGDLMERCLASIQGNGIPLPKELGRKKSTRFNRRLLSTTAILSVSAVVLSAAILASGIWDSLPLKRAGEGVGEAAKSQTAEGLSGTTVAGPSTKTESPESSAALPSPAEKPTVGSVQASSSTDELSWDEEEMAEVLLRVRALESETNQLFPSANDQAATTNY